MPIEAGSRIGAYEILALVGEGGMGRVFRARDTRLKRDVAVKTLLHGTPLVGDRLARFRREAQALAALNHPHIAGIHDIVEHDGTMGLVLEFVDGDTIADRVRRGPIPVSEALVLARQVAEALEAAHAAGIVHRDLKPANIKTTSSGAVKVLDFGLAKVFGEEAEDAAARATITSPAITAGGVILGTALYMSPEQARGQTVDSQTDVWAFGCILYEMLAGRRAFEGSTVTDVLAAVVRGEPDWSLLPADTPAGVRLLLRRCLQKDRSRRLHHIADVRIELEDAASDRTPVPGAPVGRANAKWAWLVAGGALAAVAGLSFVRLTGRDAPVEAPEMRVDVATPSLSNAIVLALSPDGQQVVFNASDGEPRLWLRSLGTTVARPLKGTDSARSPFWSPDGRYIGFFSEGKLKRLDVAGGLVQTLADAPFGAGGSWNNDGVVVFAPSVLGGLFRITKVGDAPEALTAAVSPLAHHSPQFLPDGRHFIFHVRGSNSERGVYVGSLDGTEPRKLVEGETAGVVTKSGHLLFVRQRTLFAQPLDMDGLKLTGQPVAVADEVAVDTFAGIAAVAASAAGPFAYRRGGTSSQQLIWYDRAGKQLGTAGQIDRAGMFNPDLSPDGGTVAISRAAESNQDVWQLDVVRGIQSRVTLDDASDQVPVWSPDGRQIVFSSNRKGTFDLYRKTVASSSPEELLMASPENKFAMGFSTDGKYLMYRATMPGVNWDLLALPLDGATRTPVPVAQTTFQEMIGEFSPDGRWVAYQSNESGSYEVYIQSFPTASVRMQVSTRGGSQPRWRRDGRELFYIGLDNRLMAVSFSIDAAGRPQASAPIALFPTRTAGGAVPNLQKQQFAVTKDGRFLINASVESGSESPITLVLNWRPPGSR